MKAFALSLILLLTTTAFAVEPAVSAASSINSFGLDVLRKTARAETNALISPYSIETALAMTWAGADGVTRDEMATVLHLGLDESQVDKDFASLRLQINGVMQRSAQTPDRNGGTLDPITLTMANRLFGQQGFPFRAPFLERLKTSYGASLEQLDFSHPAEAAKFINGWVEDQTAHHIHGVMAPDSVNIDTCLVLVNAIYFKAAWQTPFGPAATKPLPFYTGNNASVDVPTMAIRESFGYAKYNGFTAVAIPYQGGELQFLILLPDATNGLARLESELTQMTWYANLPVREVILFLPKFKIEPPTLALGGALRSLGMKSAFGNADFDRMVSPTSSHQLSLSQVLHKTFLNLDEKGTEAGAATFVDAGTGIPPKPVEVDVNHPFIFAIQHRASGACLFLGHVADPRMTNL
jgi:serpin B